MKRNVTSSVRCVLASVQEELTTASVPNDEVDCVLQALEPIECLWRLSTLVQQSFKHNYGKGMFPVSTELDALDFPNFKGDTNQAHMNFSAHALPPYCFIHELLLLWF